MNAYKSPDLYNNAVYYNVGYFDFETFCLGKKKLFPLCKYYHQDISQLRFIAKRHHTPGFLRPQDKVIDGLYI